MNRGTNAIPSPNQMAPYTLFQYNPNGAVSRRERKLVQGGAVEVHSFHWDGDDRLREILRNGSSALTAQYNGAGLRVAKAETRGGSSYSHDYSWSPFGLLHDSQLNTTYSPGLSQRANGVDRFMHGNWLGSTQYMTDSTGVGAPSKLQYEAFGN